MSYLQKLIESARRKQPQIPGQLGIPDPELTIGDIELEEMWQEHCDERRRQMARERALEVRQGFQDGDADRLMAIYEGQSDFMRTLRAASAEPVWASEPEAMQEWRSRTLEDFGFQRTWIE